MSIFQSKSTLALSLLSVSVLTACTSSNTPTQNPPIKVVNANAPQAQQVAHPIVKVQPAWTQQTPQAQPKPVVQAAEHYASFNDWKQDFTSRAIALGYEASLVQSLMNGAAFSQRVVDLDHSQAEFTKMPWEYVNSAVSSSRISQGRAKLAEYPTTFNNAQSDFGVPKEIVAAIWGLESSFGAAMGNMNLVDALSTLAYDGRRREFAENQLLSILQMIRRGDASVSSFKGSWAGGMGHTQFIPSTWMKEGVDGNRDGQISPWSIGDSLNSTASYLKNSGWLTGLAPYYEVRLPTNFNYNLLNTKQSLDAWRQLGISSAAGEHFGGAALAELWLPAGINGPALLLTPNFEVIRVYNNSTSYALAVSLLAKRLSGGSTLVASWPSHEQPLSRSQIQILQRKLSEQGFDTGGVDGVAGANTRRAFAMWQAANGRIPDGFISQNSASSLIW